MNDERLWELLRRADGGSAGSGELNGARAYALGRRRVRRRTVWGAGGLAACVVAAGLVAWMWNGSGPGGPRHGGGTAATRPGAAGSLVNGGRDSAAEIRGRIEEAVRVRRDHRRALQWVASVRPMDFDEARDEAARTMVLAARRRSGIAPPEEIKALYQRTLALFPETPWADAARDGLKTLELKE